MKITPHLSFNGTCEEAFKFYAKCLGGKIAFLMRYGESPMAKNAPKEWPADWGNKVIHARLTAGGQEFAGADAPPDYYYTPQGYSVTLEVDNAQEAEKIFKALSEGARSVHMPLQETFWALRFGMFVDRYGTPWMINCGKPLN
ncbi:MAG TPA: VOC family protein [Elusimicrobiota bacterium]|nr:VOC family protein [Elusimicrobiota bacterium]